MSDTEHTPWTWYEDDGFFLVFRDDPSRIILEGVKAVSSTADMNLIADAPLHLEEVKRLRSGMQDILDDFETTKTDMWSIIKRIQELIE